MTYITTGRGQAFKLANSTIVEDLFSSYWIFTEFNMQTDRKLDIKIARITQLMKTNFGRLVFGSMTFTYAYKILPALKSSVSSSIPPSKPQVITQVSK